MHGTWTMRDRELSLERVLVMGIVNVTPDSFSDGGEHATLESAVAHAKRLVAEGANLLDVGGESTRPGAPVVPAEEEKRRVVPVIAALARDVDVPLSVDTMKADVARAALVAGAHVVNDVTAGTHDAEMLDVVGRAEAGLVLMHMQGTPRTMQLEPRYADVVAEVRDYLQARATAAYEAGVPRLGIAVDPGIGFGKTLEHNLELLRNLRAFGRLGFPVLVGVSRKSFVGRLTGADAPKDRLEGTLAATSLAVANGANVIRTHDVAATKRAIAVAEAIAKGGA
ncbi:MAG: dihydropteroate synthase [Thermoplasmatota archaeon]